METTYGHNHCAHSVRDADFFRSRTLNQQSAKAVTERALRTGQLSGGNEVKPTVDQQSEAGIYPRHGTGQFVTPYYRRDSTGFRRPFTQPAHVDDTYTATMDLGKLERGGLQWAHPSSRPTYAAQKSQSGQGVIFGTSYKNSGVFDRDQAAHTSSVTKNVAAELQKQRSQELKGDEPLAVSGGWSPHGSQQVAEGRIVGDFPEDAPSLPTAPADGYYTGEVLDQPPPGAELYEDEASLARAQQARSQVQVASPLRSLDSSGAFGNDEKIRSPDPASATDPLLVDSLANANRKSTTVYKRSFGKCL